MKIKVFTYAQLDKHIKSLTTKISNKVIKDVGSASVTLPTFLTVQRIFLDFCPNREQYTDNNGYYTLRFLDSQAKDAYKKTFTSLYNHYLLINLPTKKTS